MPRDTQIRATAMTASMTSANRAAFGESLSIQVELGTISGIVASLSELRFETVPLRPLRQRPLFREHRLRELWSFARLLARDQYAAVARAGWRPLRGAAVV